MNLQKKRPKRTVRADHARCPSTGKLRYKTQESAENALKTIILNGGIGKAPDRVYPCDDAECGGWHLTSSPRLRPY